MNNTYISQIVELTSNSGFNLVSQIAVDVLLGILIIIVGVFLGKLVKFILRKITEKIELRKIINYQLINLGLNLIKWAIYLTFFALALQLMPFPTLTNLLAKFLVVVPAITSALILLLIGFLIANYLRELIIDTEVGGYRLFANYIFYFLIYIFGVYTLNIALVSLEEFTTMIIMLLYSFFFGAFILIYALAKRRG